MEVGERNGDGVVRRQRLTGAQRQRMIFDAAAEVFARRGYDGARLEEIATAAGVSKALIYEHFDGKRELFTQIFRRGTDELLGLVLAAAAAETDSHSRLEAGLRTFLDYVSDQPAVWRVIEQDVSEPELVQLNHDRQGRSEKAYATLIAHDERIAGQDLDPAMTDLFAVMINGAAVRAANWWLENPDTDSSVVLESIMDFVWLGMDRIASGERELVSN
jgi:AcrR family transcriptional regulator